MRENQSLNLFVYGTLMRGFRANAFLPEDSLVTEGRIVGNLYHYNNAGYPIIQLPKDRNSIEGTLDYDKDIAVQNEKNDTLPEYLPYHSKFGSVFGELYKIPYSNEVLGYLDTYEGFHGKPNSGLYDRTLVEVETKDFYCWAWVYNMNTLPVGVTRIYSGNWKDCFVPGGLIDTLSRFSPLR